MGPSHLAAPDGPGRVGGRRGTRTSFTHVPPLCPESVAAACTACMASPVRPPGNDGTAAAPPGTKCCLVIYSVAYDECRGQDLLAAHALDWGMTTRRTRKSTARYQNYCSNGQSFLEGGKNHGPSQS